MKTIMKITIGLSLLFLLNGLCSGQPAEIWVSPDGSDQNPGTRELPVASVQVAQRKARELRRLNDPSIKEGLHIILKDGTYRLTEPLFIRPEDSGNRSSPTLFRAKSGASPVISGSIPISNWKKPDFKIKGLPEVARDKVWVADAPVIGGQRLAFRQLWVNGHKATRAAAMNDGEPGRILSADKLNEAFWIPVPEYNFENIDQLEFIIHQWWAIAILRVKDIIIAGDKAKVTFNQPESRIEFEHPWPAPFIDEKKNLNGNSAFWFANSISLLNSPGEWYEDINTGKVYYWPHPGEDLEKAETLIPYLETLVHINGTLENPVSYVSFQGISFEHTTWMRPSKAGHVPLQAGMFIYEAYKLPVPGTADKASLENQAWTGRQPAGISIEDAAHITFHRCKFKHMAATALDFTGGTHHNNVEGCIIRDIGGTGIQMGYFGGKDFEAHLPYIPYDQREVCMFESISNNLITDISNEDWGCVGISIGYAHDINIEHNELSHLNYSGICIGWGWTKTITCMKNNRVHANHIHHFAKMMYDVGGIYTLSAQPNTEISNNSVHHLEKAPYAHMPEHYQYIYLDEGSSYIRVTDNWTENDKFFSNTPGPGNEWKNNGPQVDPALKEKAGLQQEYLDLLDEYNIIK
ncbi:MAG: right-handed parallel beta-helix repeat-containing protein [Bacteroidales bacterium]|nr:right-handed parallel beta-helix repeat-containing protein [Bacteroidales bacterium]